MSVFGKKSTMAEHKANKTKSLFTKILVQNLAGQTCALRWA
jgi:hypothetical protein